MRVLFADCHSVEEAIQTIATRLKVDNSTKQSIDDESARWRLRGIYRCLKGLSDQASFADTGALLRETTRLADGQISLPLAGTGITPSMFVELQRFGLRANLKEDNQLKLQLMDDDELPDSIKSVLRLDPALRRHYKPEIPDATLLRLTPYSSYQAPTQKAAIRALMTMPSASTLSVTMPTGSGKSLLFQFSALWWRTQLPHACSVVVIPTVALAQDHERTLRSIPGLESSRALTGEHGSVEREEVLMAFNRGEIPILLLSPEMALGFARRDLLTTAKPQHSKPDSAVGRLTTFFVDEAHIIESWGRSFRPDFQRLPALVSALRQFNPDLRVVLLSATLGKHAREELHRAYAGSMPMLNIDAQAPRYEFDLLSYPILTKEQRDDAVVRILDVVPRPCLLYTTKVQHAHDLYQRLKTKRGYRRIALFTGKVSDLGARRSIVEAWSKNHLDLVVATSAFGLGIDKEDVRAVIHACVPESTARYYQEIGRAGRDGHQGLALCLWHNSGHYDEKDDLALAYGQATQEWLTVDTSIVRWYAIVKELTRTGSIRTVNGKQYASVSLDVTHEGLDGSSDYNRDWNMTLLNLLQRAGAIEIQIVGDDERGAPVWHFELIEPRLLQNDESGRRYLEEVFALRETEKAQARQDVNCLRDVLTGANSDCMLASVFEAVEDGRPMIDECGRCNWCRSNEAKPSTSITFKGLDINWPRAPDWISCNLSSGVTVIHPTDGRFESGFSTLIGRLAATGLEQFVTPNGSGALTAQILRDLKVRCGVVLETHHLLGTSGWTLANLPTALLIEDTMPAADVDAIYSKCKLWTRTYPEQALVIMASPAQRLFGRLLAQIASASAPYRESALDDWAKPI